MASLVRQKADVVVVGSGPGGATVARGLSRAGKGVVLLERGRDYRRWALYGTYPGAMIYADRSGLLFTREGLNIIRPLMAGGATSMYCGCAAPPTRVAQGQIWNRSRPTCRRDGGGTAHRAAPRRLTRRRLWAPRGSCRGAGLRMGAPAQIHGSGAGPRARLRLRR